MMMTTPTTSTKRCGSAKPYSSNDNNKSTRSRTSLLRSYSLHSPHHRHNNSNFQRDEEEEEDETTTMVVQSHGRGESGSSFCSELGSNNNNNNEYHLPLIHSGEEKQDKWDDLGEDDYDVDVNRNSWTRVAKPSVYTSRHEDEAQFPKERMKTFLAFCLMTFMFVFNTVSIALTHDRVPDRETIPPLPDIVLDNIHPRPELMHVPDVLVMVGLMVAGALILLHHHRWILARRMFFITSVLYLMRSITMYVTVLPIANHTVYCSPKMNSTTLPVLASRVSQLLIGGGLQISGMKKACGDYIYSGHTVMLVMVMLMVREYSPQRWWILHWTTWLMAWGGMGILLWARGHYTIDVLIGYYAGTRMFWAYHTLANNPKLKVRSATNFHSQVWWFRIFQYLERNVRGPLPRRYSFPFSVPSLSSLKLL